METIKKYGPNVQLGFLDQRYEGNSSVNLLKTFYLKAENGELLGELVKSAVDNHVEFRKFKYFPLDPNYVTPYIKEQKSYKEAEDTIKVELEELSSRLNNSVPFFNFRSQVNSTR